MLGCRDSDIKAALNIFLNQGGVVYRLVDGDPVDVSLVVWTRDFPLIPMEASIRLATKRHVQMAASFKVSVLGENSKFGIFDTVK